MPLTIEQLNAASASDFVALLDGTVVFHSLVNPGIPVPPFVAGLTGIDERAVRAAPPFEAIVDDLLGRSTYPLEKLVALGTLTADELAGLHELGLRTVGDVLRRDETGADRGNRLVAPVRERLRGSAHDIGSVQIRRLGPAPGRIRCDKPPRIRPCPCACFSTRTLTCDGSGGLSRKCARPSRPARR